MHANTHMRPEQFLRRFWKLNIRFRTAIFHVKVIAKNQTESESNSHTLKHSRTDGLKLQVRSGNTELSTMVPKPIANN